MPILSLLINSQKWDNKTKHSNRLTIALPKCRLFLDPRLLPPHWLLANSLCSPCVPMFSLVLLTSSYLRHVVVLSCFICSMYFQLALLPESMCVYVAKSWPATQGYPISSTCRPGHPPPWGKLFYSCKRSLRFIKKRIWIVGVPRVTRGEGWPGSPGQLFPM